MSTYIVLEDGTRLERPRELEGATVEAIEAWEAKVRAATPARKVKRDE
jgi:hypothetical protein